MFLIPCSAYSSSLEYFSLYTCTHIIPRINYISYIHISMHIGYIIYILYMYVRLCIRYIEVYIERGNSGNLNYLYALCKQNTERYSEISKYVCVFTAQLGNIDATPKTEDVGSRVGSDSICACQWERSKENKTDDLKGQDEDSESCLAFLRKSLAFGILLQQILNHY